MRVWTLGKTHEQVVTDDVAALIAGYKAGRVPEWGLDDRPGELVVVVMDARAWKQMSDAEPLEVPQ